MVWRCIWGRNKGPLIPIFEKSVNRWVYIGVLEDGLDDVHQEVHDTLGDPVFQQDNETTSGKKICVRTHQALRTLWTHPGRAHTAPNVKRTGNVNSDTARHGTVHSDAVCKGAVRPDAARHGICLPDGACQGIFLLDAAVSGHFLLDAAVSRHFPSGRSRVRAFSFWMQPCQCIFFLDTAVSGQTASGRRVSWHHGHAGCQGTVNRSKYSSHIRKHAAGSRHSDSVQFYSLYLMYIYICYYHTSRGNKGKLANTTRRVEHDAMSTTR